MSSIPVYSFEDAINKSSLDASAKLILYVLNSHARNNTKHCFLTVKTIASEANLSKRCVFMKFKNLEEAGFLVRKQQYKDNEQKCNIYVLRVPHPFVHGFSEMTLQLSDGEPDSLPHATDSLGGCNRFTGGVNTLHTELINSNLLNLTQSLEGNKKSSKNAQEEEAMKEEFEDLWKTYPKANSSKPKSEQCYLKARKSSSHEEIMKGLEQYKNHLSVETWKKPQMLTTWLNSNGWEIEYTSSSPQQSSSAFAQYEAFAKTANVSSVSKYS